LYSSRVVWENIKEWEAGVGGGENWCSEKNTKTDVSIRKNTLRKVEKKPGRRGGSSPEHFKFS